MKRILFLLPVAIAVAAPRAEACGPDFPEQLTLQAGTLLHLDEGVFVDIVTTLVPPPATRFAVVVGEPDGARETGGEIERHLYAAGAAAYRAHDLKTARTHFASLLGLPAASRRHREVWAHYMVGTIDDDPAHFEYVRTLVKRGAPDPLGLAVASLGEQARRTLHGDLPYAVALYAAQASHGDPSGATSLLVVARELAREPRVLSDDPLVRALMAVYLHSRPRELNAETRDALFDKLARGDDVAGAERLAAAAYRLGRWDDAARLAAQSEAPLSRWVRAKLALRHGQYAVSDALFASLNEDGCGPRIFVERAIRNLQDGDAERALAEIFEARDAAPYDVIRIAERRVTIEALQDFERHVVLPYNDSWRTTLRDIIARRLVRERHSRDALPYFAPETADIASAYLDARARAETTTGVERARALYTASRLAREHGMEILGTVYGPDWGYVDGEYDVGSYTAEGTAEGTHEGDVVEAPQERFHYRGVASALAASAADELPHTSQAFAATLCHAARYVRDDRARVATIYARYVREGPWVPFAATFGEICPEPDFPRPPVSLWWVFAPFAAFAFAVLVIRRRPRG